MGKKINEAGGGEEVERFPFFPVYCLAITSLAGTSAGHSFDKRLLNISVG